MTFGIKASHTEQEPLNSYLTWYTINSRWITTLNIKSKAVKFLEENIGEYIHDFKEDKDFLDWTLRGKTL